MKYFGTDGIRDRVTGPLLQPAFVFRVGRAIGRWLKEQPGTSNPHVVIGRDTRASGGPLMLSIARGLDQEGIKVFDAGICPTPATANAVRMLELDAGIVITASHNPATDNGIKLFTRGGCKLTEAQEARVEELIAELPDEEEDSTTAPPVRYFDARRHYLEACQAVMPASSLVGMRIVLDCANGATHRTSPEALEALGAHLVLLGCEPDGDNINAGLGSEHPEVMSKAVLEHGAQVGIAHDGDGDRVILCDHHGIVIDGDAVMAILGCGWAGNGQLSGSTVVATIMSNLGLDNCLAEKGVAVERVGVGDRQVFQRMREKGFSLGGESSGHFIAMDYMPTGDGLLAALLVLREMRATGKSLADLAAVFQPFPQIKKNLLVRNKPPLDSLPELQADLQAIEKQLGKEGRILLRYSGTEPKVRLLSEAADAGLAQSTFNQLEAVVRRHLPVTD